MNRIFQELVQWVINARFSLAGKAAIWVASGSSCWSKKMGRSSAVTSRNRTSFVESLGASLSIYYSPTQPSHLCVCQSIHYLCTSTPNYRIGEEWEQVRQKKRAKIVSYQKFLANLNLFWRIFAVSSMFKPYYTLVATPYVL